MAVTGQAHREQILYAKIAASTSGNNTLVAGTAGKRVRVLSYKLVAAAAVTIKFQTGAGGADLSGPMAFAANGGSVDGFNEGGWFQTEEGHLLNLNLSDAVSVGGHLSYVLLAGN